MRPIWIAIGDGVFDLMTYDVLDSSGNVIRSIEDYGMDGQLDLRLISETAMPRFFITTCGIALMG